MAGAWVIGTLVGWGRRRRDPELGVRRWVLGHPRADIVVACLIGVVIALVTMLPAIQFSGLLMPVASMSPDAQLIGGLFPSKYFQHISVGTFTKALELDRFSSDFLALANILLVLLALARLALRTQER